MGACFNAHQYRNADIYCHSVIFEHDIWHLLIQANTYIHTNITKIEKYQQVCPFLILEVTTGPNSASAISADCARTAEIRPNLVHMTL